MWWLLVGALAHAGPAVEGFVIGALDDGEQPEHTAGGLGVAGGWRLGWLEPEVRLMGGLSGALTPWVVGQVGLRAYLTPVQRPGGALSLVIGGGGALTGGSLGLVESAGLAVDLPARRWPQVRVEGRLLLAGLDPAAAHLSVGIRWGRDPVRLDAVAVEDDGPTVAEPAPQEGEAPAEEVATDEAVEEPIAEEDAAAAPATVALPQLPQPEGEVGPMTPESRVRLLYPVCDVVSAGEAGARLPAEAGVRVESPGYLPERLAAGEEVALEPASRQGDLVVIGWPGDRIEVDGVDVALGEDGVGVVHVTTGDHAVALTGGGRRESWAPYVLEGHALWLVSEPPEATEVLFLVGSARVDAAARRGLAQVAAAAGDWRFSVQGSFSPEGDEEANRALGRARAQAVADVLVASGLDASRVEVLDSAPPRQGLSAREQRRVDVVAVREEGR